MTEYANAFGLRSVVNRCGVIAGPWQMGKVDQGVFTYWMLAHYFNTALEYIGLRRLGQGRFETSSTSTTSPIWSTSSSAIRRHWAGITVNVGGGRAVQPVALARRPSSVPRSPATGSRRPRRRPSEPGTFGSTSRTAGGSTVDTSWRPTQSPKGILTDIFTWIQDNERAVKAALMP